jgi:hypothetical protein
MVWALGGILLWLGGWWFTGRLFAVYSKAVYLEDLDHRRQGLDGFHSERHPGVGLFLIFDLGLLLLGIRSTSLVQESLLDVPSSGRLVMNAVDWSILICLYLLRQASNLHRFYYERWRGRTGHGFGAANQVGTLRGLWNDMSPLLRILFVIAPLCAATRLVALIPGLHKSLPLAADSNGGLLLWLVLPHGLLLLALASPLLRARRLARARSEG